MARSKSVNDRQIALRVPPEWLERAEALRSNLARPGIAVTRTDVIRAAIARGLDAFDAERGVERQVAEARR